MDKLYELIIIGSGPAGMSAALYASRAGIKCAMIEAEAPGGKLLKTAYIDNYPGYSHIQGADLAISMYEQSTLYDGESLFNDVIEIKDGDIKEIKCANNESYYAKTVIIASGTKERLLNISNEEKLTGRGVSYCAICDGAFYKEKDVCVIGGGNSAVEGALYLANLAHKVYLVIRRNEFRADSILVEQLKQNNNIEIIEYSIVIDILEKEDKVSGIVVENVIDKSTKEIAVNGIFPYIGADANTSFVQNLQITNKAGYIEVDENMQTKIPGIYAAGDVRDKQLRQVVTAVNDGAIAAQSVQRYLNERK